MLNPCIRIFSVDGYYAEVSKRLLATIESVLAHQTTCSIALSGGNTPRLIYPLLAKSATTEWDRVAFYFTDERGVPADHLESNFHLAKTHLFEPLGIGLDKAFRMKADHADAREVCHEYAQCLPECLDIALLGMGADGHTASIFPGVPSGLDKENVYMVDGPKHPKRRMTLSKDFLERTKHLFVIASGRGKAEKVKEVLSTPVDVSANPVQLALNGEWLLDTESAVYLKPSA